MPTKKGKIPWNKGVPHTKGTKQRISQRIKRQYENGRKPWNKGKHLSKEIREKISHAKKGKLIGEDNPFYGKHHSEETRMKISLALQGRQLSSEERGKISSGLKRAYGEGRCVAWLKGKHHSEEERKKISASLRRAYHDGRREAWMKGKPSVFKGRKHTKEAKEKNRQAHLGKRPNENQLRGLEKGRGWNKGKKGFPAWNKGLTKETDTRIATYAKKISEIKKRHNSFVKLNKDSKFQRKRLQGLLKRPTKPEARVIDVIRKYSLPYRYVGDGKVVIEGMCPDFINNNGAKRIIEIFGDYWHRIKPKIRYNRTEAGRRAIFARYGFKTLILWESKINQMSEQEIAEVIEQFEV